MGDVSGDGSTLFSANKMGGPKKIYRKFLESDGVDDGDTFDLTLADFSATKVVGILGFIQTTEGKVVAQEQPTTTVTNGVLQVTVGGSTDNKARYYEIWVE